MAIVKLIFLIIFCFYVIITLIVLFLLDDKEDLSLKQRKFETVCSLAVLERFHQTLECQFVSLVSHNSACASVAISCLRYVICSSIRQLGSTVVKCLLLVLGIAGSNPDKVRSILAGHKYSFTVSRWDSC